MLEEVARAISPYFGWISLLFATTVLIYWFGISGYSLTSHVSLPGPKPWPYVGNLVDVAKYGGLHKAFVEYGKQYGKVYKMYLGRFPMITVADPEMLRHILVRDFDKFPNRPDFTRSNPPLDVGLFSAQDDTWRRIRSILTPMFSLSKLKEVVPIIEDATDPLMDKLMKSTESERSVDVSTIFGMFSLDVILRVAFGLEAEIQTNPDPELVKKALTVFDTPVYIRLLTMLPFYQHVKNFFHINILQNVPYFLKVAQSILEVRKKSTGPVRRDLVQLMLEAREDGDKTGNKTMNDKEMIVQSFIFLLAGSETTGATLAFTAYHLAHNPEIQEILLHEIDNAVRSRSDASMYEFVQSLRYLDQVICEVLRLDSVGFVTSRQCKEACVIRGVEFPLGVVLNIPSYAIHRDPDFWPEPEKFDPDRFLPEETEKRPSFSYLPFGLGQRQCIGTKLALLEMKIALAMILQRIKFEKGLGTTENLEFKADGFILRSRDPIFVKLVRRSLDNE